MPKRNLTRKTDGSWDVTTEALPSEIEQKKQGVNIIIPKPKASPAKSAAKNSKE
jgi:hypothetical protein